MTDQLQDREYQEHLRMWHAFTRFLVAGAALCALVLIGMALFLT